MTCIAYLFFSVAEVTEFVEVPKPLGQVEIGFV